MTRRSDLKKKGSLSLRDFSLQCARTLDKGVDTYKSINELGNLAVAVCGRSSGEIDSALNEMSSVIVHLAATTTGGDVEKTKTELASRGLPDIL